MQRASRSEEAVVAPETKDKGSIEQYQQEHVAKGEVLLTGAGETVMAESDLPEVPTKESWGSKHGQAYEVANGE